MTNYYDTVADVDIRWNGVYQIIESAIKPFIDEPIVLDIGTSTGEITECIYNALSPTYLMGIESNLSVSSKAHSLATRYPNWVQRHRALQRFVREEDFNNTSFNVIFCLGVIQKIEDSLRMRCINALLEKKATFVLFRMPFTVMSRTFCQQFIKCALHFGYDINISGGKAKQGDLILCRHVNSLLQSGP